MSSTKTAPAPVTVDQAVSDLQRELEAIFIEGRTVAKADIEKMREKFKDAKAAAAKAK